MTTHIILQARMSSSRLPKKVLKRILGKPMLAHQIERLKHAQEVDHIIVATSNDDSDDEIVALCQRLEVNCFRGNLNNVLDRFYQASLTFPSEHIVRITGDCPLIDADIIDAIIKQHKTGDFDYTSNCEPATFPDGLDVEVMRASTLKSAWQDATKPSQLEHVTPYIRSKPEQFRCGNYLHDTDLSSYRWTVDEPADFDFVSKIYQDLYPENNRFGFSDILKHLEQYPELMKINQGIIRNEGFLKSQQIDKEQGYD